MTMLKQMDYFAYGSNLHPVRLESRIGMCQLIGVACLEQAALSFRKIGLDQSGKCDLIYPQSGIESVWGVVYRISTEQKTILDRHESLGSGYQLLNTEVIDLQQKRHSVFTYQVMPEFIDPQLKPFDWYHELVMQGARHHRFPAEYLQQLKSAPFDPDPDQSRLETHERILKQIRDSDTHAE